MIGSGWLFGPLYAAQIAGPFAVFSWILGGLLIILVAFTFSEVSAMLPVTGGIARFPQFSHGPMVSFIMTWIAWIAFVLLPPIEVQALIQYSAHFYPRLVHSVHGQPQLSHLGFAVEFALLLIMSLLNIAGVELVAKCNNFLVAMKLLIPTFTSCVLILCCFHPSNFILSHAQPLEHLHNVFASLPLAGVIFSFFGFRLAIDLAGEAKNPQKAMPIALIGSITLCMILYTFIQIGFIGALPAKQLALGFANLHFPGDAGPFVGIAAILGLHWLIAILYVDAIISPFGSALIIVTTSARLNYAMGINGYAPKWLTKLNPKHVPHYGVLLNFLVGCLLVLPFPGWQTLASFILSALVISHAITPISLAAMREQVPDRHRPFKIPAYKIFSLAAFIILNFISYWTGWNTMWKMLVGGLVGLIVLPIIRCFQNPQDRPQLHLQNAWWLIPYFAGMALFSYLGNFGDGLNIIPFGYDMLFIALFSIVIFKLGVYCRLPSHETIAQIEHETQLLPFSASDPMI